MMYLKGLAQTSLRHRREENQDACFYLQSEALPGGEKISVQVVLDGISYANGGQASRLARRAAFPPLADLVRDVSVLAGLDEDVRREAIFRAMRQAVCRADRALCRAEPDLGSTISIAVAFDEVVYTCNVGDSPVYLLKIGGDGQAALRELFCSHNQAALLVREGRMTRAAALHAPQRNCLLKSLGSGSGLLPEEIPMFWEYLGPRNVLLLGSDGALSVLPQETLTQILLETRENMPRCIEAVYDAVSQTESTDNFTISAACITVS